MAQYTTYDTVGIKEDVSDIISNISPTKTPFQSIIGGGKTRNRHFEWLEDSLADAQANAQVEGFDATDATLVPPVMRDNYTQIFEKTIKVSATEDAVDQYGRRKETAYQLAKGMAEVKRDRERALIGVDQAAVAGDTVTARHTASVSKMIDAAVTIANGGVARALDETQLLDCAEAAYGEGAEPNLFMIKPADARIMSAMTGSAGRTRNFNDGNTKLVNVVDLYVSPYGTFKVVLNRFQLATDAYLIDPGMWSLVTLRPWSRETLAKTGDNSKNMIVGEFGLKHRNFKGSGRITDLS
jgi:hypothetical protein